MQVQQRNFQSSGRACVRPCARVPIPYGPKGIPRPRLESGWRGDAAYVSDSSSRPHRSGLQAEELPGEGSELSLAEMPGWKLIHTPGHTPGHVSFFRESDRTLLVGDAFCTTKAESFFAANLFQPAELHGPPSYFTSDWGATKVSVRKLAGLGTCNGRARARKTTGRGRGASSPSHVGG